MIFFIFSLHLSKDINEHKNKLQISKIREHARRTKTI